MKEVEERERFIGQTWKGIGSIEECEWFPRGRKDWKEIVWSRRDVGGVRRGVMPRRRARE